MFTLELSHLDSERQNPVLALYYQSADRHNDNQWEQGQDELERYLVRRFGGLGEGVLPVHGVLAIGAKVKIFKYDAVSRSIERFVPPWDLERHHGQVWDMLGDISRIHTGGYGSGVKRED